MFEFVLSIALLSLGAFCVFIFLTHLFTFLFLLIEYNLNRAKDPASYPDISLLAFMHKCLVEFLYMAGKYYLYPYKFINLDIKPRITSNPPECAILLIHGYLRNQTDWLWFSKQLITLGYPIFTVNLIPALGSIQEISFNSINDKIAQIKQQTNCQQIVLIGHSMGGLVASYYSEYCDDANLIKRIINIGTPFHGTKISVLAAGANAKQMLPGALFTSELRDKIAKSTRQYFHIATKFDNIVLPWQSELLETKQPTQQHILSTTSHLALLHSPEVVNKVKEWLST